MSDARRLRALEDENGKLKNILAQAMLEDVLAAQARYDSRAAT